MPLRLLIAAIVALVLLAGVSQAADPRAEFPSLLERLEKAKTPYERGFDQMAHDSKNLGQRVVQMLGAPDTWDAYGTPALRGAVIARWRKRWEADGESMLRGLWPPDRVVGRVEVQCGAIRAARDIDSMRHQFLLNNGRLYELGGMDGSFPPSGFMLGDQSGIWAPPVKVLDGFGFIIREAGKPAWRLDDCQHFSHDFATGSFHFIANGWNLTRTDFPAAEEPAFFSRLTLTNRTQAERSVEVDFVADVNIRPDWRTAAHSDQQNDVDEIETQDGLVRAWDPNLPKSMVVLGADLIATKARIEDARSTLTYRLQLPAGGTVVLNCLVRAGLALDGRDWATGFRRLLARSDGEMRLRRERIAREQKVGIDFACSDHRITEAFALAKANVRLLTADCRPHFPDVYLMAGVPVYPRLFACDSCMSLPGVIAAGLWAEARGTLACLAAQARKSGSLIPHESATDGTLIGPSNSQETTQFIATCAAYLRWTADRKLATELYPLLVNAIAAHRKQFASDGYPAGPALIETNGTGARKVDAACWQYAALAALAEIANCLDKKADCKKWTDEAARLRTEIRRDWWMPANKMWADSLDSHNRPRLDGLWSVAFPLMTDVASAEQIPLTLDGLEFGWTNQWGGVHTRQSDIRRQGSGVVSTGVFGQAAFAHRRGDLGFRLLQMNAEAPRQDRMPGAFTEMIPPGGSDFAQLWSIGPFLSAVIEGLAGLRPNAFDHHVEVSPQLPADLDWLTLDRIRIGDHTLRLDVRRDGKNIITTVTHTKGSVPLTLTFIPTTETANVLVDGKKAVPVAQRVERLDRELKVIRLSLAAGGEVRFSNTRPMSTN